MKLELSEEELTQIIKEAFVHYAAKPFGFATYVLTEKGVLVQFHDVGTQETEERRVDDDSEARNRARIEDDRPAMPAVSFPNPFPFGGFGGGSSGGGGASGGW